MARESESPATQVLDQAGSFAGDRAADDRQGLSRVRVGLGVLGVALLLLGGVRDDLGLSPILVGAAFLALLAATLIGGVEGWSTRGGRHSRLRAAARPAARGAGTWPSRIGLAIVGLAAAIAAQSWFDPGRLLAGGDMSPVVGTAWLGRLFAPWSWSGSNLGGPAANETRVPSAAVYWLVHALRGSPALAEEIWYTALFVGAAAACYLLLRALRVGPAGSTLGALAYVFNAHVVTIGTNPVFLAAMVLLRRASGSRAHHGIRPVGAAKGRSPPRRQCAAPRLRIPEPAARVHDRRASRLDAAPRGVARRTGSRTPGATHPRTRRPAPRARLLLLARTDRVAAQDRRDLNARQSVELDLDRGPRHPCQRVLAEQRLGLEVRGILPVRRRLR